LSYGRSHRRFMPVSQTGWHYALLEPAGQQHRRSLKSTGHRGLRRFRDDLTLPSDPLIRAIRRMVTSHRRANSIRDECRRAGDNHAPTPKPDAPPTDLSDPSATSAQSDPSAFRFAPRLEFTPNLYPEFFSGAFRGSSLLGSHPAPRPRPAAGWAAGTAAML